MNEQGNVTAPESNGRAHLNGSSLYPPLDLPTVAPTVLKRGLGVQVRYFYADSVPGNQAKVVRHWNTPHGIQVRCNFGKNLGGQSLLKTMPLDALALA